MSLKDARGLHALDEVHPLVAGYVVHAGSNAVRLADRCWALPAAALA